MISKLFAGLVLGLVLFGFAIAAASGPAADDVRIEKLERQLALLHQRVERIERLCSEPVRRTYAGIGQQTQLRIFQQQGATVYLINGTSWAIAPADRVHVLKWAANDPVVIGLSDSREFPYGLINLRRNEVVQAQYLGAQR